MSREGGWFGLKQSGLVYAANVLSHERCVVAAVGDADRRYVRAVIVGIGEVPTVLAAFLHDRPLGLPPT